MAHSYTPGLQVSRHCTVRLNRALPIPGQVLVKPGQHVTPEEVIAETRIPNDVISINIANQLGAAPEDVPGYMLKKEGEAVKEGQMIAENHPWIKWFKTSIPSPVDGTIESISRVTGQVLIRKPPREIQLRAHIDGRVVELTGSAGVVIESGATYIQGIFGVGGERNGILRVLCSNPDEPLSASCIKPEHKGEILVCGSLIEMDALEKATELGVAGLIAGGIHSKSLRQWLGYDIGIAITGDEDVSTTIILTEGFGWIAMASGTFDLLKSCGGMMASINGRTQIRAGVMRPEIIIPCCDEARPESSHERSSDGVHEGDKVRIIREPYFGSIGKVKELVREPIRIETEAMVRVMEVELPSGEVVTVPRANVERIEEL
jgi:hypothetical protein